MRLQSYQGELKDHLQYLGIWDNLVAGKLKCFVCKVKLSADNFGLAFRNFEKIETTVTGLTVYVQLRTY